MTSREHGAWSAEQEQKTVNRLMLGFVVFVIGVGCGYAWHFMAVG